MPHLSKKANISGREWIADNLRWTPHRCWWADRWLASPLPKDVNGYALVVIFIIHYFIYFYLLFCSRSTRSFFVENHLLPRTFNWQLKWPLWRWASRKVKGDPATVDAKKCHWTCSLKHPNVVWVSDNLLGMEVYFCGAVETHVSKNTKIRHAIFPLKFYFYFSIQ